MPLYSDMYYNYLNSVPPSVSTTYSPYSSTPSSYSLSSPSYTSSNYSSLPYTPSLRTGASRYLPKLTTISEAPLSKHRLAALSRISASHNVTPKYIPPRPRRIDTSDIDVSASRYQNRRISESKSIIDIPIAEDSNDLQKDESKENVHVARTTIRRDRGLVRLRTTRLAPDTQQNDQVKKPKVEQSDIDPGYGSSERSSGSWRKKLEKDLEFIEKPLSPTSKSLGESFIEKYTIKEKAVPDVQVYMTIDDLPLEQREFIRRKSGSKLPTFKEICSDISSDKLTDDLNAGDLRRRASLIIEEEMSKFLHSETAVLDEKKSNDDDNGNNNTNNKSNSDRDADEAENETERQQKTRKIKKRQQRTASKTLLSEITEKVDEIKETALDDVLNETEVDKFTLKMPQRKKKKITDVKSSTCDSNSDVSTASHTPTPTAMMMLGEENERKIAEINATEKMQQKQPESLINIKSKQQQHSSDLDIKLLIEKNANDVHFIPGEEQEKQQQQVKKNQKSSVKLKTSMKSDVQVPVKSFPLKREPSADDFWGMIGSRETAIFAKRKQMVIEEQQNKISEIAWVPEDEEEIEEEENSNAENSKVNNLKLDHKLSESNKLKISSLSLLKDSVDTKSYENTRNVGEKKISTLVNENEVKEAVGKSTIKKIGDEMKTDNEPSKKIESLKNEKVKSEYVEPRIKLETEKKVFGSADKSIAKKPIEKFIQVKSANAKIEMESPKEVKTSKKVINIEEPFLKKPEEPLKKEKESTDNKQSQLLQKTEISDKKEVPVKKVEIIKNSEVIEKKLEVEKMNVAEVSLNNLKETDLVAKKSEEAEKKLSENQLKMKKSDVIEKKLNENVFKIENSSKKNENEQTKIKIGTAQPLKDKLIKDETQKIDEKSGAAVKETLKSVDTKISPPKAVVASKPTLDEKSNISETKDSQKKQEKPPKSAELNKIEPKPIVKDKSPPKTAAPIANKKVQGKSAVNDKKTEAKSIGSKKTSDNKSTEMKDNIKTATETPVPTINKKLSPPKDIERSIKKSTDVNDQEKITTATNDDGIESNKKKKTEEVLNENQSIELNSTTSNNNKNSPTSLSKKSFGTLSKFPTLNNLNSIAMNDAVVDNETINNNNQSIVCEQLNKSEQKISIALEPSQVTASEQQKQIKESRESETEEEEEESSYETESSEEEEVAMGKKDFDPQKKVRLDFTSMQKFFKTDEKSNIKLVARPRPLWKIKRNRHAKFSSSESETDEEVEEICGGDSATGGSQSSTNSEKVVKQVRKNKTSGNEISTENIVALMSTLNLNEDNDDNNDNAGGSDEQGKKKQSRFSTSSHDSGYSSIGATAAKSPRKALDCDVNCHKKCEKLAANLCGVNQKLIVEALATVRRENQERLEADASRNSRESLTPPSLKPTYQIDINHDEDSETSYTYTQFQKTGKMTAPATVIPRFRKYSVEDFHFLTVLGKGSFGKVFLAELKNTSYYYAIKCLKKDVVLEDDDVECTLIERKVLALGTRHPYLCHLFCTFQTDSHLFFVMEYLTGGDLMFHIQQSGRFTEKRARFYAAEIVSGLKFLHRKGIIYRDLKLDNVLLDHDGHVRLADFGMCKLEIYLDKTADSFCGTPDYMPPEIIKGLHYNQSVDYWSFGVLLYEMLIGQSPFSGCDEDELFWSICNEIPWYPHFLSKEALKILQSLLEKDVSIRLGSMGSPDGDVKYHPFFAEISWEKLDRRELEPPFKPHVRHPLDTQYFDSQFTRERARLTPIDKNILISMNQNQFEGFSYTNPNATLTKLNEKKKKKEPKRPKFYFCPCCGEMKITETLY